MSEEPEVYEIESIIGKRTNERTNTTEYKIKWKNYGENEATWEPLENLIFDRAFGSLFQFENSQKAKEYPMNEDTEKFLEFFKDFDPERGEDDQMPDLHIGNFKKPYTPEKIIKLERNAKNNELYALIEWKEENGIKPLNSLVNTRVVAVFAHELYIKYLEDIAYFQLLGGKDKSSKSNK